MAKATSQSPLFKERYAALNAEQREAVDTLEGPVMVIAGPGTGKTTVLTMRIANILAKAAAKPERILALTFTESGASAIRRNLADLIGEGAYRVEISTFHGFANRIIRDYPDYFPEVIGASSITEIDQVSIVQKLLDSEEGIAVLRPFGDRYYYLRNILAAINELKRQGVSPTTFAQITADEKKDFYANPDLMNQSGKYEGKMKTKYASAARHIEKNLELAAIYAAYQKALRAAKQYDYSDMIMQVAQALETNEDLARVLSDLYEYFLVDEHQDTNDAQNKIIERLVSGEGKTDGAKKMGPNLFVVGDEKQAIFRFQGASLENFLYFKNKYKDVKLIALRSNYRSTQAILDAAQGVSPRETELVAKAGHTESPAHFVALSSPDAEYFFIARKIKELTSGSQEPGASAENIAVLYRDNKDVIPLARMFEKQGVPFVIESDQDVLGDLTIKKLIRILRAVEHFGSDAWLVEALHVDFIGVPAIDMYKLAAFAKREHVKIYDVIRSEALLEQAGIKAKSACAAFFQNLSAWKRASKNKSAGEAFEIIVRESGFLKAALDDLAATETIAKLHTLFDLLKSFMERQRNYKLDDFFTYLDLMEEHGVALKGREPMRLPGRVRLMTAHRSKGLEFDYVFIMDAMDRKWGSRFHKESIKLPNAIYRVLSALPAPDSPLSHAASSVIPASSLRSRSGNFGGVGESETRLPSALDEDDEADDKNADERNVFYVALTRARKEVFITMSVTDRDGKEQLPTQFIAEMKPDILSKYDVTPYEADFAAHRTEIEFAPAPPKTPELKDKEFLNALFDEQGLSVTAINNYLECPWHYFYVNLIRVPEAPNKHLAFGNAIHAALKNYFDKFATGEDLGKAYLVKRFEEALAGEPMSESEFDEALEKGRRALPAFYDEYHTTWSARAVNEARIDGVHIASDDDDIKLKGNLDRIEFLDTASSPENPDSSLSPPRDPVRVIDYKTGKPITRNEIEGNTKNATGNYKRQLVFYKLLLDKEGRHDMQEGVIQFIEPDDRAKFHREQFVVTPAEVTALEAQIVSVAHDIKTLAFWDAGCHDTECKYCELRKGM